MTRLSDEFPAVNVKDVYTPTRMQYSSGYYHDQSVTLSNNKLTVVGQFKIASFSDGNAYRTLFSGVQTSSNEYTPLINVYDNSTSAAADRDKLRVILRNTSNVDVCHLQSNVTVADDALHTFLFAYDGDAGTAVFLVDGVDADDTGYAGRVAPITGTLNTALHIYTGTLSGSILRYWSGSIGPIGFDDQYITSLDGFFDADGNLIKQDENNWGNSAWGSQPLVWNEHGDLMDNKGSSGAFTHNGTITTSDEPVIATGFGTGACPLPQFVVGVYEDQDSTSSLTQVLNVPSHQEGDFLLTCLMKRTGGGVVTPPAGWDYDGEYTNVGGYQRARIYTKVATASEPASYTWTQANSDRISGQMIAVSNVTGIAGVTEDAGSTTTNTISMPVGSSGDVKWIFHHWVIASSGDAFSISGYGAIRVPYLGVNSGRRIGGGWTHTEGDVTCVQSSSSESATVCIHLSSG